MFDLSGKTALVTGATQGIGFAAAQLLAKQGATVFVAGASSLEKCQKACDQIPGSQPVLADLRDPDCAERLYAQTGPVDILVLSASIQFKRDWDAFTSEEFDSQLDCNVKSTWLLIRRYSQAMKENRWGRIVTVGSVNQYRQHPALALYAVTKAAQLKLIQNIAPQLAPYGVTVNNIAPGAVDTPRNREALADPAFAENLARGIPCGYIAQPQDIAPSILFLCSEESRYITGADLAIDGGMHLL